MDSSRFKAGQVYCIVWKGLNGGLGFIYVLQWSVFLTIAEKEDPNTQWFRC